MDYLKVNKKSWNNKVESHIKSTFYNVEEFLNGASSLNNIELNLLGDVQGKSILHLQCHFGQDSISLERMGAKVTGVDLSDKAIENARDLAKKAQVKTAFICCDVYDLPNHLNKQFDVVFTTYGTIGWLPDLNKWAQVVSTFLKPNGQFVFVEFHPVVWMFDNNFEYIKYNYFNTETIIETETGSYADKDSRTKHKSITWNHSISDVINGLIKNGLTIQSFDEFDYSPYDCFNKTVKVESKKFRIEHLDNKIPMVYAIKAIKKS